MPLPLLSKLLPKLARKIGAKVTLEPQYGYVGQITFKNGKKRYFRYSTLDINTIGAGDIAKDKGYAKFFMSRMGYPVANGKTFYSTHFAKAIHSKDDIDAAWRYAQKIGLPVIVKPNSKSQGSGVAKAEKKVVFYRAARAALRSDSVMLVEETLSGHDYRIVVLDEKVISAYERLPLAVVGDGKTSVHNLLKNLQREFTTSGRDTMIDITDPRMCEVLKRQQLTFRSVPKAGKEIILLDNANLSTGGMAIDVTETMHSSWKKVAINLTRDMGLRLAGVDIMITGDCTKPAARQKYWIIEINAAPGLDHYFHTGKKQEQIVEAMYLEVLKAMAK